MLLDLLVLVRGLGDILILGAVGWFFVVVFDSGFVVCGFSHIASDTATGLLSSIGRVLALDTAFDDQRVGVGELNVDVFLFNAGKFAVQLVGVFVLADIELGLESTYGRVEAASTLGGVVVEETEERVDVVVGEACEERHCQLLMS